MPTKNKNMINTPFIVIAVLILLAVSFWLFWPESESNSAGLYHSLKPGVITTATASNNEYNITQLERYKKERAELIFGTYLQILGVTVLTFMALFFISLLTYGIL